MYLALVNVEFNDLIKIIMNSEVGDINSVCHIVRTVDRVKSHVLELICSVCFRNDRCLTKFSYVNY